MRTQLRKKQEIIDVSMVKKLCNFYNVLEKQGKESAYIAQKGMENSAELKKGRKARDRNRALVAYSFIAPNFIGFAVFTLVPIVCAFALGFFKWDGNNPIQFAGLENFKRLTGDTMFWASLKNTIIYCIGTVPLTMIASLALAIILNQKIEGSIPYSCILPVRRFTSGDHSGVGDDLPPEQGTGQRGSVLCIPYGGASELVRKRSHPPDTDLI